MPVDAESAARWRPPASWRRLATIGSHAAGEPLRVIVEGLEPIPGATILEKRRFARESLDGLRRALMFEPRGHADMYGAIPTAAVKPRSEEHTSELQSRLHLVCRLLLEKKNTTTHPTTLE